MKFCNFSKRLFSVIVFFLVCLYSFAADTEADIYNEMVFAYKGGFYPGSVKYSSELIARFPNSSYVSVASVIKGESLVRLGLYNEALDVLVLPLSVKDDDLENRRLFWLARSYDFLEKPASALPLYYRCAASGGENFEFFKYSIHYSALILYSWAEYEKAVPLFEYVVKNGNLYEAFDFYSAVLKLSDFYNRIGKFKSSIALFENLKDKFLDKRVLWILQEYAGDAFYSLGEYKNAWLMYTAVIENADKSFASNVLKKAYIVAFNHRQQVGVNPKDVLADADNILNENPELVSEFWVRLGIDAFDSGDFAGAEAYFMEAEVHADKPLKELISLYKSRLFAGNSKESAAKAINIIIDSRNELILDRDEAGESKKYGLVYKHAADCLLSEYAARMEDWNSLKMYSNEISPKDGFSDYYLALAEYKLGNYVAACNLLKDYDCELYALSLLSLGDYDSASSVYSRLDSEKRLSEIGRLNFAKVLFLMGRFREAMVQCEKSSLNEAKYILGLSSFNTRSWVDAEKCFSSYIENTEKKSDFKESGLSYAEFYLGYARYRLGKNKEAYKNFSDFTKKYTGHELIWNAYITAANCALQYSDYKSALTASQSALKYSKNEENLEESVLLCSGIYKDLKDYNAALDILAPYAKLKTFFGMKCLYQIGGIYEEKGDIQKADEKYKEVSDSFLSQKEGEEAMYRRGEIFYNAKNYETALERFNAYTSRYPNGDFIDSAWYFSADCLSKTSNYQRAILLNQALLKRFPQSIYVYGTAKNLIDLYRRQKMYMEALNMCKFLLSNYNAQAVSEGIEKAASEIEKLLGGKNEEIVLKENEYQASGKENSVLGRKIGTELAELYAKSSVYRKEGQLLAKKILEIQKKNLKEESLYAAQNAKLLADGLRTDGQYKEAGEIYLYAVEYYRMNGKSEEAASALYSAYEAYSSSGLKGDAEEVLKTLIKLYPDSRQAKSIRHL